MYGSCARGFTFFWFHGRSSAPRLEKVLKLYRRIRGKVAVMTLVSEFKHSALEDLMRVQLAATAAAHDNNRHFRVELF